MEDNTEQFPEASLNNIINKIKKGASGHKSLQDYAIFLLRNIDKNGDGVISFKEFCDGLK